MAQKVKVLGRPNDLSSVSGIYIDKERTDSHKLSSGLCACMFTHTHLRLAQDQASQWSNMDGG